MNTNLQQLLENAGIRVSAIRLLVLRTLNNAHAPMSGMDIETALESVDRSSITRTLAIFTAHSVVHTVDDGSGSIKYELCHDNHLQGHPHSDIHPHFHCISCGSTICLEGESIPPIHLPDGYIAQSANYVIKGFCPKCSALFPDKQQEPDS